MSDLSRSYLARGRTDGDDRLLSADEPLAGLQVNCGGEIPGDLAIPELRDKVRRARKTGARWAGAFEAIGEEGLVRAWVEIFPHDARQDGGCSLGISDWTVSPLAGDDDASAAERRAEVDRATAELSARLDPAQRLLAVEGDAPDLAALVERMADGAGKPWTDFVDLPGAAHEQPMHWRLLDGAAVRVPGSQREWTASLVPLGRPEAGSAGFELHLVADRALASRADLPPIEEPTLPVPRSIGQDLAPVLRQPIARIIANAETIRTKLAGPLAEEYSAYAADIASAGQHLLGLIEDLTDLEVVESEEFITAPDRIDLADVARRACGILAVRAGERDIVLAPPCEGEVMLAVAEFRRVLQILLNLLGNAIRYGPQGSEVTVSLERVGDWARVIVADRGQGLDPSQQAKVFAKFERLGRKGDGGSGLGLYISRRIARAMGGDLTVESEPGQGARFILAVPAAEDLRKTPR